MPITLAQYQKAMDLLRKAANDPSAGEDYVAELIRAKRTYESEQKAQQPLSREAGLAPGAAPTTAPTGIDMLEEKIPELPDQAEKPAPSMPTELGATGGSNEEYDPTRGAGGAPGNDPYASQAAREERVRSRYAVDPKLADSRSSVPEVYASPAYQPPTKPGANHELSAWNPDVETFYEPSLAQFSRENPDEPPGDENSLAYRVYADAAYKKAHDEAVAQGRGIVRPLYTDVPGSTTRQWGTGIGVSVDRGLGGALLSGSLGAPQYIPRMGISQDSTPPEPVVSPEQREKLYSIAETAPKALTLGTELAVAANPLNPFNKLAGPVDLLVPKSLVAGLPNALAKGATIGGAVSGTNAAADAKAEGRQLGLGELVDAAGSGAGYGAALAGPLHGAAIGAEKWGKAWRNKNTLPHIEREGQATTSVLSGMKPTGKLEEVMGDARRANPPRQPEVYLAERGQPLAEEREIQQTRERKERAQRVDEAYFKKTAGKTQPLTSAARRAMEAHEKLLEPGMSNEELAYAEPKAQALKEHINKLVGRVELLAEDFPEGGALEKTSPGQTAGIMERVAQDANVSAKGLEQIVRDANKNGFFMSDKPIEQFQSDMRIAKYKAEYARQIAEAEKAGQDAHRLTAKLYGQNVVAEHTVPPTDPGFDEVLDRGQAARDLLQELNKASGREPFAAPPGVRINYNSESDGTQVRQPVTNVASLFDLPNAAPVANVKGAPKQRARRGGLPTKDDAVEFESVNEARRKGVDVEGGVARWLMERDPSLTEAQARKEAIRTLRSPTGRVKVYFKQYDPRQTEEFIGGLEDAIGYAPKEGAPKVASKALEGVLPEALNLRRGYPKVSIKEGGKEVLNARPQRPVVQIRDASGKPLTLTNYAAEKQLRRQAVEESNRRHDLIGGSGSHDWEGPLPENERAGMLRKLSNYGSESMSGPEAEAMRETYEPVEGGKEILSQLGSLRHYLALKGGGKVSPNIPVGAGGLGSGRLLNLKLGALRSRLDPLLESISGEREGVNIPELSQGFGRYSPNNPLRLRGGGVAGGAGATLETRREEKKPGKGPKAGIPPALILPILRYLLDTESPGPTTAP